MMKEHENHMSQEVVKGRITWDPDSQRNAMLRVIHRAWKVLSTQIR